MVDSTQEQTIQFPISRFAGSRASDRHQCGPYLVPLVWVKVKKNEILRKTKHFSDIILGCKVYVVSLVWVQVKSKKIFFK